MKHSISMAGCLSRLDSGEASTSISIDLSAIDAAPVEEFSGFYDHLLKSFTQSLQFLEFRLSPSKPMVIAGCMSGQISHHRGQSSLLYQAIERDCIFSGNAEIGGKSIITPFYNEAGADGKGEKSRTGADS